MSCKADRVNATRRELLTGAGALGLAGVMAGSGSARAQAPSTAGASGVSVADRGRYATVPLRQDAINLTAIQSRVRSVDVKNLAPTMQANLDHALELIDIAQGSSQAWGGERLWGAKQDLICMHDFPIQGFQPWTRSELNRVAFDLPGPETEAIGVRAKKYGCYIAFGCYAREKDWPRHVVNISVIAGLAGGIAAFRKTRRLAEAPIALLAQAHAGWLGRAAQWLPGPRRVAEPVQLPRQCGDLADDEQRRRLDCGPPCQVVQCG
jgi:hypothetical protein